jgi:hypothetical protein
VCTRPACAATLIFGDGVLFAVAAVVFARAVAVVGVVGQPCKNGPLAGDWPS